MRQNELVPEGRANQGQFHHVMGGTRPAWRPISEEGDEGVRTLVEYEEDAAKAVSHSHMLWLHVNRVIHKVIETAIAQHKSRQWVHDRLMKIAGPKEKGEPISLCNFRSAATQILLGEGELVLL